MKRILMAVVCLVAVPAWDSMASQAPQNSPKATPIEAIKELDRKVDSYRVGKLTPDDESFNRALKHDILTGTFDLNLLARLALDKHWGKLSAKQQEEFVQLLTDLLEARSVFAKEKATERGEGRSYAINYKGQDFTNYSKTDALAKTTVNLKRKGIKVSLNYKLRKNSDEWKIYDVIMDDASLVQNYRYSFGNIIQKHGYPELVRRMRSKLVEFRAKQ